MDSLNEKMDFYASPEKAEIYARFFKTGKGQYGEGDKFIGIAVPQSRKIAKQFTHLNLTKIKKHLSSKIHEERLIALMILVEKFKSSEDVEKKKIFDFYLKNTTGINNWDLVDLSADKIIGSFLIDKEKNVLHSLASSQNLWERRIAIVSTFVFIKNNQFEDTLKISESLLNDKHDLIHKAVGWMLREVGKKNTEVLEDFIKKNYPKMPRTTLRYAIEKFPEEKRKSYLKGEFK